MKVLPQLLQINNSTPYTLHDELQLIYPAANDRAELLVSVAPEDYSASAMARAIEDCNLHLINLNVTPVRTPQGHLVVALRVNGSSADAAARSLQRYGYDVLAGSDINDNVIDNDEAARRAAELLHMLEI